MTWKNSRNHSMVLVMVVKEFVLCMCRIRHELKQIFSFRNQWPRNQVPFSSNLIQKHAIGIESLSVLYFHEQMVQKWKSYIFIYIYGFYLNIFYIYITSNCFFFLIILRLSIYNWATCKIVNEVKHFSKYLEITYYNLMNTY